MRLMGRDAMMAMRARTATYVPAEYALVSYRHRHRLRAMAWCAPTLRVRVKSRGHVRIRTVHAPPRRMRLMGQRATTAMTVLPVTAARAVYAVVQRHHRLRATE